MQLAVPYILISLLMADFVFLGFSVVQANPFKAWLAVLGYFVLSAGLMLRSIPGKNTNTDALKHMLSQMAGKVSGVIFSRKILAGLAALLFLIGQFFILGAGRLNKIEGMEFAAALRWGLGLTMGGLLLAAPYFMKRAGRIHVTPQLLQWFLVTVFLGGFLWWSMLFLHAASFDFGDHRMYSLFDDAMISLRYALNFTEGNGLVWNIGERVEGYTNLLMVLVMSIGTFLFSPNGAVLYTHIVGVVFIVVIAFCLRRIAAIVLCDVAEERRGIYAAIAFFLPLSYYPLVYWSVMGMETGLLSMLVTAAVLVVVRPVSTARINPLFSLLLGMMVLVRPDAVIQAGLLLLFRFITLLPHRKAFLVIFVEGLLFCVLPAAQLFFRHSYYNEWLPNTYTLKMVGLDIKIRVLGGWGFMKIFIRSVWPALLLGTVGTVWQFKKEKALILLLMLSVMAYQVYVGGDPWPYWRIMAPYLPLLLLLNMSALESFFSWMIVRKFQPTPRFQRAGAILVSVLTVLLLVISWTNLKFGKEIYFLEKPFSAQYNASHVRIGLNLKEVCKPEATVGVFWAGTIPYFSGLRGIDFLGKCDKTIANLEPDSGMSGHGMLSIPGHNKYNLKYSIVELKPDYIQNYYWVGNDETVYAKEHYIMKNNMLFKKDSVNINWDRLPD